jgi:hypothetical protein
VWTRADALDFVNEWVLHFRQSVSFRRPTTMHLIHLHINLSYINHVGPEDPKDLVRQAVQSKIHPQIDDDEQAVLRAMFGWIETNLEFVTHAGSADATRKAFLFGRKGGAGPDVDTVAHGHLNAHWPFVTPVEEEV